MISEIKQRLCVRESTAEGDALLMRHQSLREAMEVFLRHKEPQKARIPGLRLIGKGKFSFTFAFHEQVAIKLSGPRTSLPAIERDEDLPSEDLCAQFQLLSRLRRHPGLARYDIVVPRQYLVALSPSHNFILVQELMKGWESIAERIEREYYLRDLDDTEKMKVTQWTAAIRVRMRDGIKGFDGADAINDLFVKDGTKLNTGNILIPVDADLSGSMPLCIIDQPKLPYKVSRHS